VVAVRDKAPNVMPEVDYDREADVLYVSLGRPQSDEGEDHPKGIVLRYRIKDNLPSGVTVIGFRHFGWHTERAALAETIAAHLSIDRGEVERAIAFATT
jgi:hypothetical protein